MKIPFNDLSRIHNPLKGEFLEVFQSIMGDGSFILGPLLEKFEEQFASYCGTPFAVGTASGSDALELLLRVSIDNPRGKVLLPALTFCATLSAVERAGFQPVLIDVDPENLLLDPEKISQSLDENSEALLPVHLFGNTAPMEQYPLEWKGKKIIHLEDACQAHGAFYRHKRAGNLGEGAAFSFYPGKNLGAFGDGGLLTLSDGEKARKAKVIRNYGQPEKYRHLAPVLNCRLDTLQAAILSVKLPHLDNWNRQREEIARFYSQNLADLPLKLPSQSKNQQSVHHLYPIRTPKRDLLQNFLTQSGISTGIHYPHPLHLLPAFESLGYQKGDFPVAEKAAQELLSLPIFPGMRSEEMEKVVEKIHGFFKIHPDE